MNIDIELIQKAKDGDEESFGQLYDALALDLYKYALYSLGNPHDAEDVVSETFMDAYRGLKKLRDAASFKPWIMKILSIKIKRKIGDYVKERNVIELSEVANTYADPADMLSDGSENASVGEAFKQLSGQERQIITLSVFYGYTTKEISQMLGCPHGTISSKLHRSLMKLRNILE